MISLTHARGKRFALFGLGSSGLVTAKALMAGGADVSVWDDQAKGRESAAQQGFNIIDLQSADWKNFDSFILSPGVPLTHPQPHWTVGKAHAANVEVIGDIELFCRERQHSFPDAKLVAITGTNGKSTTTALTAHILREAGRQVEIGGNIGRPALDLEAGNKKIYVLECSSFQIDLAPSLDPDVGVLLNVTEDHLDRHGTLQDYADVKEKLIAGIKEKSNAILGIDDPYGSAIAERVRMKGIAPRIVTMKGEIHDGIWFKDGVIYESVDGVKRALADLAGAPNLRGTHNAQNAACAFVAARACNVQEETIIKAMQSFPGLAHRMQRIGTVGKVEIVNDSKATNADAAAKALASYENIYWIAGGRPKTGGIHSLKNFFPIIRHAYLIGEAAADFAATLEGQTNVTISGTVDKAVTQAVLDAQNAAAPNPVILFSPACASFDQFRNFEERGDAFIKAASALKGFEKAN